MRLFFPNPSSTETTFSWCYAPAPPPPLLLPFLAPPSHIHYNNNNFFPWTKCAAPMQDYCILTRAHLRGLGVPIFQAKNIPCKVFITVSNYQVHICYSVRDIYSRLICHFTIDFLWGIPTWVFLGRKSMV